PAEPFYEEPRGVFVSLKLNGELRGCIGYMEALMPLGKAIIHCAIQSATQDPRFPPLNFPELELVKIEISVLSPLEKIEDPNLVEVGTHGLVIAAGNRRGLLLPQVPGEWGWDRETFLNYTCRKAGLPSDAWRDPETSIYIFSAEVFRERDYPDTF
ncbi:MAG TPA: AmmeMemoRadiSam system protein A, partial [Acidobacteriota bacterium]|nr:AmmeMemoRadiSam system protein A [Acidobacteriota bacterium]